MTFTQLTYVVAVDTHRHFGEAAAHCNVTQPTLSMQLRKLEDELGVRLFDRSQRPVLPTDVGARVVAQARAVLRERDRMQELIADAAGTVAGALRLGVIPTLAPYLLPLVTEPFATAYPAVSVTVREMTTTALLDHLATDRLDAALIATEEKQAGLLARPLFSEPFVAYVAPAHRLAAAEAIDPHALTTDEMWLLSEGHCFRDQVFHLCGQTGTAKTTRPIRFESGNLETLRMMVDRAGGLTLLPYLSTLYMDEEQKRRCVRPLTEPAPRRVVRIAYGRAYLKRPLITAYVEILRAILAPYDAVTLHDVPDAAGA